MVKTKLLKNGIPAYCGEVCNYETTDISRILEIHKENFDLLMNIDKQAKEKGELLGRFVAVPIADGRAYYQIVKENKNTVKIKLVENIGDDYMVDYWGCEATIDKDYAADNVEYRDKLDALFS